MVKSLHFTYGAVHLEAAYGVHQIKQVSFAPISYRFSRNVSFDERNISSEPILIKLKIDGLLRFDFHPNWWVGKSQFYRQLTAFCKRYPKKM